MYHFSVNSKLVWLFVAMIKKVVCPLLVVLFCLCGQNGSDWQKEFHLWCAEREKEWTHVTYHKKSYAHVVLDPPDHKNVFKRLHYLVDYYDCFTPQKTSHFLGFIFPMIILFCRIPKILIWKKLPRSDLHSISN